MTPERQKWWDSLLFPSPARGLGFYTMKEIRDLHGSEKAFPSHVWGLVFLFKSLGDVYND